MTKKSTNPLDQNKQKLEILRAFLYTRGQFYSHGMKLAIYGGDTDLVRARGGRGVLL
jgi:hypothetical protein